MMSSNGSSALRIDSDRGRARVTVEHVRKPAMQPGLASGLVAPGLNRFMVHMRVIAGEARHLLGQPVLGVDNQFVIAAIPEVVTVTRGRAGHPAAGGFERVHANRLRIQGRQLAVPVHR